MVDKSSRSVFIILSPASPPPLPAPLGQIIALLCAHHLSHHLHHMLSYPRFATLYSPLLVENIRMLLAVPCLVAIAGVCVCSVLRGTLRSNTIQKFSISYSGWFLCVFLFLFYMYNIHIFFFADVPLSQPMQFGKRF